jgi:hypothetical protein
MGPPSDHSSSVEEVFLEKSGRSRRYTGEHIQTLEILNLNELGRLTCLRFLEWVYEHPNGVIALPTGRMHGSALHL